MYKLISWCLQACPWFGHGDNPLLSLKLPIARSDIFCRCIIGKLGSDLSSTFFDDSKVLFKLSREERKVNTMDECVASIFDELNLISRRATRRGWRLSLMVCSSDTRCACFLKDEVDCGLEFRMLKILCGRCGIVGSELRVGARGVGDLNGAIVINIVGVESKDQKTCILFYLLIDRPSMRPWT